MSAISLEDAEQAAEEAKEDNLRENDAGIPDELGVDWDQEIIGDVSLSPKVLLAFDHIARISINDYGMTDNLLAEEQNLARAGPQNYGFDVEITVADPEVITGQLWAEDDPDNEDYPAHKLIGDPNNETNPYDTSESVQRDEDGEIVGSTVDKVIDLPGGNTFAASEVEEVDADYMTITIPSSRASNVLGVLDTAGKWYRNRDGEVVEGLFETPPNFGTEDYDIEEDGAIRLVSYPELRADMVGQAGAFLCTFDVDDETEANTRSAIDIQVLTVHEDGEMEALRPLSPDDEAYALPTYPRGNALYWDGDSEGVDGDVGADAEPETEDGVAQAQSMMSGADSSDEDDTLGYEDLTDDAQEFVDDAIDAMEEVGFDSASEFEDFEERVATVEGTINADADELADIIDQRV